MSPRVVPIGQTSLPEKAPIKLTIIKRFQLHNARAVATNGDIHDQDIVSPKSAKVSNGKLFINSLEGFRTVVYDANRLKKETVIRHKFGVAQNHLFQEENFLDYTFHARKTHLNVFSGKPVEMCTSHGGKYLWVSYYRRSYDPFSIDPSAVAIINTETMKIVRVMPTAPLPKMIACSPDNRWIAVTNWGDNTVHLIDIKGDDPSKFKYAAHFVIGRKLSFSFKKGEKPNRDKKCGYCLRGTVFSPDSKYLLVGLMGGAAITVFDIEKKTKVRSVFGMMSNVRHLTIYEDELFLSANLPGYVQKTKLKDFIQFATSSTSGNYSHWESVRVGTGARTITVGLSGRYIFAAVNNSSEIKVIDNNTFQVVATLPCDSYPVGLAYDEENNRLIVTTQGRINKGGGHSVLIARIEEISP